MCEIVRGPSGKQLRERDSTEGGMQAAASEIVLGQVEGAQFVEIFGAKAGELIQ